MKGIIGKKIGMTSVYNEDGRAIPVTVVEAGPCVVTQVKTSETDGYNAVQLGFDKKKESRTTKALKGHFDAAKSEPKRKLIEFRDYEIEVALGDVVNADIFEDGEEVRITGTSKGKGFQGVVKRHGFKGVGMATHGQHNRLRAPGSIGQASTPSRVFKGMRMAGRTGQDTVTTRHVEVVKVLLDKNLILIKGPVPGARGSYVIIGN